MTKRKSSNTVFHFIHFAPKSMQPVYTFALYFCITSSVIFNHENGHILIAVHVSLSPNLVAELTTSFAASDIPTSNKLG